MTRKFINIFMIMVFAMQALPVKQVGNLLFGNQITADMVQDIDDTDDLTKDCFKIEGKSEFIAPSFAYVAPFFTEKLFTAKEVIIVFPHNHSTDIYSPPPNSVG